VKRRATERQNVLAGETKLVRRKRKLPVAMISYIKPRRKRRFLAVGVRHPSSHGVKSEIDGSSAKSAPAAKSAVAELTGRHTSASIMSRYRRLDRHRSQSRRISGRASLVEDGSRPSTRSQTVALMHRQLIMARMKSVEETDTPQLATEPLSENYLSDDPKCTSSGPKREAQTTSVQQKLSEERSSGQSTLGVKKEASEGEESERSMRRFIRRRNFNASGANKGEFALLNKAHRLTVVQ